MGENVAQKLKNLFVTDFFIPVKPVMIISMWVPDTVENGTESSAVLDCVYNFTEQVNLATHATHVYKLNSNFVGLRLQVHRTGEQVTLLHADIKSKFKQLC